MLPIVVMTGLDDEATAVEAVRQRRRGFSSSKGQSGGRLLARAIRYAMERKQTERQLKSLNETLEQRVAERTAMATRRAAQLQALAPSLRGPSIASAVAWRKFFTTICNRLLYAARLSLGTLRTRDRRYIAAETIERVDDLLSECIAQSRSLTVQLCPPVLTKPAWRRPLSGSAGTSTHTCRLVVDVEADPQAEPASEDLRILAFRGDAGIVVQRRQARGDGACPRHHDASPDGESEIAFPTTAPASTRRAENR